MRPRRYRPVDPSSSSRTPGFPGFSAFLVGLLAFLAGFSVFLAGCSAEPKEDDVGAPSREPGPGGSPGPASPPAPESSFGPPAFDITVGAVGFSSPESVLHDAVEDVYLVSNVNGDPLNEDGNGFISRVTPSGEVLDLKWIDGEAQGVDLDGPKGMAIVADTLFVADIRCVRKFRRDTGARLRDLCMDRASSIHDLAPSTNGDLYFSDTGSGTSPGAIYLLRNRADVPQRVTLRDGTVLEGTEAGQPKGVFAQSGTLLVAASGTGEVVRLTRTGERRVLLPPSDLALDGIVGLADGTVLVSSPARSAVLVIDSAGRLATLVGDLDAPGDIGYDSLRDRVLIPLFGSDAIRIRSFN